MTTGSTASFPATNRPTSGCRTAFRLLSVADEAIEIGRHWRAADLPGHSRHLTAVIRRVVGDVDEHVGEAATVYLAAHVREGAHLRELIVGERIDELSTLTVDRR